MNLSGLLDTLRGLPEYQLALAATATPSRVRLVLRCACCGPPASRSPLRSARSSPPPPW
jgi:hypothetical protein